MIDISNIINVSLTSVPTGLSNINVNSLALATTETPSNLDLYRIYVNASDVATDYGTNSTTYKMANAIFSQTPNILSGDGRLVIIPYINAVSATAGKFVTADLSANFAAIKATTDGRIAITVNGTDYNLSDLNFSYCSTWSDVANYLQSFVTDAVATATTNGFATTSKKVGSTTAVTMSAYAGTGTNLAAAGYFNVAGGTATAGTDSSGETLVNLINRTKDIVQYVGIITNLEMEDDAILDAATAIQALDKIFVHHFVDYADLDGICLDIKNASLTYTRCLLYSVSIEQANLMKAAYAGRGFSVNFAGSATTSTMNLKNLVGITMDSAIDQTLYTKAETAGVDLYVNISGLGCVISNGANDYFDNVYNKLWLKFALQIAGFNYLATTNTKIPQTEVGMNGLKGAYTSICLQGITNGMIASGTWNSSQTFGNPTIFRSNISDYGYYVYSLPITQQSQVDRNARKAPLVQIAVKLAGAIHSSDVIVVVEN